MKIIKTIQSTCITSLLIIPDHFPLANSINTKFENKLLKNTTILAQNHKPIVTIRKLSGSTAPGENVTNQDQSLSCSLKSWQLIGIFRNDLIDKTKGELIFEISNNSVKNAQFVLAELLIKNDRGESLTTSNPFRELQGELLRFKPPLKPRETREHSIKMQYRSGWDNITLKNCRLLKNSAEYWQIYPELKDNPTP